MFSYSTYYIILYNSISRAFIAIPTRIAADEDDLFYATDSLGPVRAPNRFFAIGSSRKRW